MIFGYKLKAIIAIVGAIALGALVFYFSARAALPPTSISKLSPNDQMSIEFTVAGECGASGADKAGSVSRCVKQVMSACENDFQLITPANRHPQNLCFSKAAREYSGKQSQ